MGVLDKFLDIMKLSDEDDYDENDDFFDDDYEDDYEERPAKKSFFNRRKDKDDYDDYEDDYEERPAKKSGSTAVSNKVTPMRQPSRSMCY